MEYSKNNIQNYSLDDIKSYFSLLETRPGLFLETNNIEELIGYINGYAKTFTYNKKPNNPWIEFECFKASLHEKYPKILQITKAKIIDAFYLIAKENNNSAYEQFWVEWNYYINQ